MRSILLKSVDKKLNRTPILGAGIAIIIIVGVSVAINTYLNSVMSNDFSVGV